MGGRRKSAGTKDRREGKRVATVPKVASDKFVEEIGQRQQRRIRYIRTQEEIPEKVKSGGETKYLETAAIKMRRKLLKTLKNEENKSNKPPKAFTTLWDNQTTTNCKDVVKSPTADPLPLDLYDNPFINDRDPHRRRTTSSPRDKFLRATANSTWKKDRMGKLLSVGNNLVSLAPAATSYNPSTELVEKAMFVQEKIQKKDRVKRKEKKLKHLKEEKKLNAIIKSDPMGATTTTTTTKQDEEKAESLLNEEKQQPQKVARPEATRTTKLTEKQRIELRTKKAAMKPTEPEKKTDKHVKYAIMNLDNEAQLIKQSRANEETLRRKLAAITNQTRRLNKLDPGYVGRSGEKSGKSGMRGVARTSSLFRDIMFGLTRTGAYLNKKKSGKKQQVRRRAAFKLVKVKRKSIRM